MYVLIYHFGLYHLLLLIFFIFMLNLVFEETALY
jgi:hypothetical protein